MQDVISPAFRGANAEMLGLSYLPVTIEVVYDDEDVEVPVGDLLVNLTKSWITFPSGAVAGLEGDLGDEGLVAELDVAPQSLGVLAEAFGLFGEDPEDVLPPTVWFIETDPPDRIHEFETVDGIVLEPGGTDRLWATVSIGLPRYVDDEFEKAIDGLLSPMLGYLDATHRVSTTSGTWVYEHEVTVMVRFVDMGGRTGGDLIALAQDVRALLLAARAGKPTERTALSLARAGHATTLIGQPESAWLDAKGQPWNLGTPTGNAELAKDMSAFANADGGFIIVPATTSIVGGTEIIESVGDMPVDLVDVKRMRDVLAQWVHPPLPGLIIELVPTSPGRVQLVVAVGAYDPRNWPHLVVGDPTAALTAQSVSAWVRDGDRNRAFTVAELHDLMRRNHP